MSDTIKTLVILAGGFGSRFGGLKQLTPITEEGNCILDFSIYDAHLNGIEKIILIVQKETEQLFRDHLQKLPKEITIHYIHQGIPFPDNEHKKKSWGTGHALICAEEQLNNEKFILINADDFYGRACFEKAVVLSTQISDNTYGMVGFPIENTLSDFGSVSRGECFVTNNSLLKLEERLKLSKQNNVISDEEGNILKPGTLVSMNFWIMHSHIIHHAKSFWNLFNESKLVHKEFYITNIVNELLNKSYGEFIVEKTDDKWFGITYADDLELVKNEISNLKKKNVYPKHLWK